MIDADLDAGLKSVKVREGIPESEQIRRALRDWLERKGVLRQHAGRRRERGEKGE